MSAVSNGVADFEEVRRERERLGLNPDDPGRPLAGREPEPEADPEDSPASQQELFVLENGERVTIGKLISRNTPIEYRFNLNSKSISGGDSMGLVGFSDPNMTLVVPCRAGKVIVDPTYLPDGTVEKVRITANFKPITAFDSRSDNARAVLGYGE
jgi:hypothetical protein